MGDEIIARWESRGGANWIELLTDGKYCFYNGNDCGGSCGRMTKDEALAYLTGRIASGEFAPNTAKNPSTYMKRVI